MASRPLFLCLLCTIATLGSVRVEEIEVGLKFAREPAKSVIASRGKPLVLACAPGGGGPEGSVKASWLVNGEPVVLSDRISIQPNGSLAFKKIVHEPPQQSDQGLYQCKLTSSDGLSLLSQTSSLRVAGMAANFTQSPKNLSVEIGDSARLSCHIEAVPTPIVLWERDNKTLPQDQRYQVLPSGVLLIDTVQESDAGYYHCIAATRKVKSVSVDVRLEVVPALGLFRPAKMLSDSELVNIQVQTSEALFLECGASGYPVPSLSWSMKQPDQEEIGLDMAPRLGTNVLSILNITVEYAGIYICTATNVDQLNIEHQAQIRYNISVLVAPRINKMPQSQVYPIAKTVRFECEMEGVPKPNITWYKNGELVHINGRIKQKGWSIVMGNTVKEDAGIYQCQGWNEAGEVWAAARLVEKAGKQDSNDSPPSGLTCGNITTTSIQLLWNMMPGNVTAYTVHYLPQEGEDETLEVVPNNSYTVKLLKPFTNYTFYVRGYTFSKASGLSETIVCRTADGRPLAAPQLSSLQAISPTSVKVSWKKLKPSEAMGEITSHRVQFRIAGTLDTSVKEVPSNMYNYVLRGLSPGTTYEVSILSGTKTGWPWLNKDQLQWKSIKMPLANDTVPLAPDVEIREVNAPSIKVRWTMSKKNKVQPSAFRISVWKNDTAVDGPIEVEGSINSYVFSSLDLQEPLTIRVQALNENGEVGPAGSRVFKPNLLRAGTKPPWSLNAVAVSSTSIKLSWEGLYGGFFSIICKPLNSESAILLNSSAHSVLINDLEPFTTYELAVQMYDKNLKLGPSSQKVECQTLEEVPGPPINLFFTQTNLSAGKIAWSAPSESNGRIGSYRVYYTTENAHTPLDDWLQLSANYTWAELTGLLPTNYHVTVRASTQAGFGKAADYLQFQMLSSDVYKVEEPSSIPTSKYTILLAILCSAVFVLLIIGGFVALRLAKTSALRSPDHNIPHTNGNGFHHNTEGIDMTVLSSSSNIPPAPPDHLDTKGGYPTPKTNGAHSNGRVPNGTSTPLLNQVHITENPQFHTHRDGKNACPSCPGPGCNSRGCPSCQVEPLLAADVTQVTVLADD